MLNPRTRTRAGGSTILWDNKELKHKEQLIANFKELGLDGILFTAGKSGKTPYGRIKKYFREGGQLPGEGSDSLSTGKIERLLFFYHPDHLGSSSSITDASGEVYQHTQYFPFGETFVEERTGTQYTPYLYNGKELDEETGLYYYGARYYDPRMGMFYGVDVLAEKYIGISSYAYVANNPLIFVDPDGRDWYQVKNGEVLFNSKLTKDNYQNFFNDNNIEGTYLGTEGFGINPETGMAVHYQQDGTAKEFAQRLEEVTVTPEYSCSSKNPSISTHNKTGVIWDSRDLAVYNKLKDHESPIGAVLRKQIRTGKFGILSAERYWDEYGHTLGNMILMELYISMGNAMAGHFSNNLSNMRKFNSNLSVSKANNTAVQESSKLKSSWNQFLHDNKGKYNGKGWLKKASRDYHQSKQKQ
jgi:RHS repeat-associated protein